MQREYDIRPVVGFLLVLFLAGNAFSAGEMGQPRCLNASQGKFAGCFSGGTAGGQYFGPEDWAESKEREQLFAWGHMGLHWNQGISLHARASRYGDATSFDKGAKAKTDALFLHIGQFDRAGFSASVGKIELPMGLNSKILPLIYQRGILRRRHWEGPQYGVRLRFDQGTFWDLDVGAAWEDIENENSGVGVGCRLGYDIPALDGTRFLFSWLELRNIERRLGVALLNKGQDGSSTRLEWVRGTLASGSERTQQLARISILGPLRNLGQIFFEYEDDTPVHWLSTLGFRQHTESNFFFDASLSYRRTRIGDHNSAWISGIGVGWGI